MKLNVICYCSNVHNVDAYTRISGGVTLKYKNTFCDVLVKFNDYFHDDSVKLIGLLYCVSAKPNNCIPIVL
jgi:hypothetical protein